MKFLITGGAGFIGSHLSERLIQDGHTVIVLDNLSTSSIGNLAGLQQNSRFGFVNSTILNYDELLKLVNGVDYVFHLAAAVGVFNIVNYPLESLLTNIRGTENVLEASLECGVPVFITSSSEVYGKNDADSLKETDDRVLGSPVTLRWSYSEAKAIDESLAYAYFVEKQLETRIVRFFNTVGPRQLGAYGMVVPRFVKSAMLNEPITIYGDGTQIRAWCFVDDMVDALMLALEHPKAIGESFNVGNARAVTTIFGLAEVVCRVLGSSSEILFKPPLSADIELRIPETKKAESLLGYKAKIDLEEGIRRTAEWYLVNMI